MYLVRILVCQVCPLFHLYVLKDGLRQQLDSAEKIRRQELAVANASKNMSEKELISSLQLYKVSVLNQEEQNVVCYIKLLIIPVGRD